MQLADHFFLYRQFYARFVKVSNFNWKEFLAKNFTNFLKIFDFLPLQDEKFAKVSQTLIKMPKFRLWQCSSRWFCTGYERFLDS